MKLYLDDERPTPEGWIGCKTAAEAITLLRTHTVEELSLDHDLGDSAAAGTGYDVVLWMEEQASLYGYQPPRSITVHSANPVGRAHMEAGIRSIKARSL